MMKILVAGQKPEMTTPQWTGLTVPKLATLLNVAEVALDIAKEHAATQRASAIRSLSIELALLMLALVLGVGMILMVSRRITKPISVIQDGMHRLAGGDTTVEVPFADRKDEIGELAGAMQAFKDSLADAERLRGEQREIEARGATQRKAEMHRLAEDLPDHGRQHRQRGVDRLRRAREGRRHADPNRRKHAAAFRRGRVGVGGSILQCADGRERGRGDERVGQRDRAPGAGVEHDRRPKPSAGRQDRRSASRSSRRRQAGSATSSS